MADPAHCYYCFDVLAAALSKSKKPSPPHSLASIETALKRKTAAKHETSTNGTTTTNGVNGSNGTNGHTAAPPRPLFVTWNITTKSGGKQLRGCIGTFEDQPLESGLRSYALTAALEDTRFDSISPKELSQLECGVSILTDFEPASDPLDWDLGTHGLRISFTYHNRRMGATYLPDVAPEQGWTKEETLQSLMRKAGWSGRKHEWEKVALTVVRYKGTKANVSHAQWKELVEFMEIEQESN